MGDEFRNGWTLYSDLKRLHTTKVSTGLQLSPGAQSLFSNSLKLLAEYSSLWM